MITIANQLIPVSELTRRHCFPECSEHDLQSISYWFQRYEKIQSIHIAADAFQRLSERCTAYRGTGQQTHNRSISCFVKFRHVQVQLNEHLFADSLRMDHPKTGISQDEKQQLVLTNKATGKKVLDTTINTLGTKRITSPCSTWAAKLTRHRSC